MLSRASTPLVCLLIQLKGILKQMTSTKPSLTSDLPPSALLPFTHEAQDLIPSAA